MVPYWAILGPGPCSGSDPGMAGGVIYTTRARVGRRHKRFWTRGWTPDPDIGGYRVLDHLLRTIRCLLTPPTNSTCALRVVATCCILRYYVYTCACMHVYTVLPRMHRGIAMCLVSPDTGNQQPLHELVHLLLQSNVRCVVQYTYTYGCNMALCGDAEGTVTVLCISILICQYWDQY